MFAGFFMANPCQFLQQFPLFAADVGGNFHLDRDEVVSPAHGVAQAGYAQILNPKLGAGLGACGNFQVVAPIHRRHGDLTAQDGLQVADFHFRVNVDPLPPELGVGFDAQIDVQIPWGPAFGARIPFPVPAMTGLGRRLLPAYRGVAGIRTLGILVGLPTFLNNFLAVLAGQRRRVDAGGVVPPGGMTCAWI